MSDNVDAKSLRLLTIYTRLSKGQVLRKSDLSSEFCVSLRSIQRDMEDLRCFLEDNGSEDELVYDRQKSGYWLRKPSYAQLTKGEMLAVCKILLESRSLRRDEMLPILSKLMTCCISESDRKDVSDLLANERFHYTGPHHGQAILDKMWEIGQAIKKQHVMEIQYERLKEPKLVTRRVEPVGIMFSEYYFYLTAFLRDVDREASFENKEDLFPTIYRIDRIRSFEVLEEHFSIPYKNRFEEGEFRKRVQFMYGGKLERVRFKYTGPSIESVLDKLPTAEIIETMKDGWVVEAEVFGRGIEMWVKSQGELVTLMNDK